MNSVNVNFLKFGLFSFPTYPSSVNFCAAAFGGRFSFTDVKELMFLFQQSLLCTMGSQATRIFRLISMFACQID